MRTREAIDLKSRGGKFGLKSREGNLRFRTTASSGEKDAQEAVSYGLSEGCD